MYVYDALTKVRSDIEKRQTKRKLLSNLKTVACWTAAIILSPFIWVVLMLTWVFLFM